MIALPEEDAEKEVPTERVLRSQIISLWKDTLPIRMGETTELR